MRYATEDTTAYYSTALEPLEPAENLALLKKAKEGDERAKELFFAHNYRFIIYMARKFNNTRIPLDERVSASQFGFLKAYNTFDFTKDVKLATYAAKCMENEILMWMRRTDKTWADVSLEDAINVDWEGGNTITVQDILVSPNSNTFEKHAQHEAFKAVMQEFKKRKKVNPRDIELLRLLYEEEMTQKEVAKALGISQSYVSRVEGKMLQILRNLAIKHDLMDDMPKGKENEGEPKLNQKADRGKLLYTFQNTVLSQRQVSKVFGLSIATIGLYRQKYEKGKMSGVTPDPTAQPMIDEYVDKLTPLEKNQLIAKAARQKKRDYTAPSDVRIYQLPVEPPKEPEAPKEPKYVPMENIKMLVAAASEELHDTERSEPRMIGLDLKRAKGVDVQELIHIVSDKLNKDRVYTVSLILQEE